MTWLLDLEITCNGYDMEQLTTWGKPHERMMGVDGRPRYEKWLKAEKKRIKEDNLREAKIVKHPKRKNLVSLWVNERCVESLQNSHKRIEGNLRN